MTLWTTDTESVSAPGRLRHTRARTAARTSPPTTYGAAADTADTYGTADDTETDTDRTHVMPNAGGRLSDAELDAVVVLLIRETDPPRSYRAMEDRFRELGYSASAARLRAAWGRVATPAH